MTHTKDREMINTNKAVVVKFAQHTNDSQLNQTGEASIYIPFPVKEIWLRGVDLDFNADFQVMYFTSSLVDNNTLGSGYAGVMYDNSTTTKQLHYIFDSPRDINGTYRSTYNLVDDKSFYFANGYLAGQGVPNDEALVGGAANPNITKGAPKGSVIFMLEFIGYK